MAIKFGLECIFPKPQKSRVYFSELEDRITNIFSIAYLREYSEDGNGAYACKLKDRLRAEAEPLLAEMSREYPPVDPKINRLISAWYNKALSFDWTDHREMKKFYMQTNSAKRHGDRRLMKLERGSGPNCFL
jgi:hypothetical protein